MRIARIARCTGAGALLAVTACSDLFGPTGPEVFVSLSLQPPSAGPLALQAVVGGKRVEVTTTTASGAETEWRGPRFGEVPGRVALLASGGDTLASAAVTLRLARDHVHWITARVGSRRPLGHCIGELTVVPLAGARTDTLFLTVGSIPKGAIC